MIRLLIVAFGIGVLCVAERVFHRRARIRMVRMKERAATNGGQIWKETEGER